MSILIAKAIIDRIGIARFVHVGAQDGGALVRELRLQGCQAVGTDEAPGEPAQAAILDLAKVYPIAPLLRVLSTYKSAQRLVVRAEAIERWQADQVLLHAGWRRHPASLLSFEYESLTDETLPPIGFYERVPAEAAARWPMEDLQERPGPAMDWLRQSGPRADAVIARYALAAEIVRPGDRVLDCACGLGAGTAVLAAMSKGAAFVGVDPASDNIAYAEANYGEPAIRFAAMDPRTLHGVEDGSVDLVVAQDVLEYADDWEAVLAAFQRVLKPDGRLICTVPDRWADGAGRPADPSHRRLFDSDTLLQALARRFLVETKHIQLAPGGVRLPTAPRILRRWPLDKPQDAEWLIVVGSANPYSASDAQMAAYSHPKFAAPDARPPVVADFGRFYDNPYLYRPLVQMGERLRDDGLLLNLALVTVEHARADSPDRGGAIAVLGYMVLERRNLDDADKVIGLIEAYAAMGETDNPHTARWRLSHAFLAGKLMELRNDQAAAMAWYCRAAELDWRTFSPLLATKTVAARFHMGRLHLLAGEEAAAREAFEAGVQEALEAARAPMQDIVGDPSSPLPFGLQELAEVVDMGSQCATALAELPLWRRSPGLYMKQIDTRRFGLATWAKDMESENRRLTSVPF